MRTIVARERPKNITNIPETFVLPTARAVYFNDIFVFKTAPVSFLYFTHNCY